jgi:hypothetical protein
MMSEKTESDSLPSPLTAEDGLQGIQISAIQPLATSADTFAVDRTSSASAKFKLLLGIQTHQLSSSF